MRTLINAFLLIVACFDFPVGLFILVTGATGSQDTLQDVVASVSYVVLGFFIMCLGVVFAAFPIAAFSRFLSREWNRQAEGRRS